MLVEDRQTKTIPILGKEGIRPKAHSSALSKDSAWVLPSLTQEAENESPAVVCGLFNVRLSRARWQAFNNSSTACPGQKKKI